MAGFWQALRTGDWLTAARLRAYSVIVLAIGTMAIITWIALSPHLIDPNGKPIGTDFSSFYAAGSLVREGRAGDAYNMAVHYAREQQIFGVSTPYYGWLYPPFFLMIAVLLALMPYAIALAVWQVATLALYLVVIGAIVREAIKQHNHGSVAWVLPALAFPAVFINLGHGQNGFLTAGLFGAALLALPRRPLVAGLLFGLLAYKPQFALVIPVALLAGRELRAFAAATATVSALVILSTVLFGIDIWPAFAASTETSRTLLLEQGDVGFEKLQSVFATIRMWGGSVTTAYVMQTLISLAGIGVVGWTWHSRAHYAHKAALLVMATLLASPHVLDYDLMLLSVAIAFYATIGLTRGFLPWDVTVLCALWLVPLVARSVAGWSGVPIGLLTMLTAFVVMTRHAMQDRAAVTVPSRMFAEV